LRVTLDDVVVAPIDVGAAVDDGTVICAVSTMRPVALS